MPIFTKNQLTDALNKSGMPTQERKAVQALIDSVPVNVKNPPSLPTDNTTVADVIARVDVIETALIAAGILSAP